MKFKNYFAHYRSLGRKEKKRWWFDFLLNNAIYIILIIIWYKFIPNIINLPT
jgi:Uri superfamily endonuclease